MSEREVTPFVLIVAAVIALAGCTAGGELDPELPAQARAGDPAYSVDEADLAAALDCDPLEGLVTEPVLLVHGTFTNGREQYDWTYRPYLRGLGLATCIVSYPDRGMGDQQVAAEYVAWAIRDIAQRSGRKVDVVGHSQGAVLPRWAVRWWPSAREATDDLVLIAGPSHGTQIADGGLPGASYPAAFWQFRTDSNFVRAINSVDETPGSIDYTNIYTISDELVQPQLPESTSALDLGREESNTVNILMQDLCPLRIVDHVTIGFLDAWVAELVVDAFLSPGPGDPSRVASDPCVPGLLLGPAALSEAVPILQFSIEQGMPDFHNVSEEPPLMPYAQGA